MLTGLVLSGRVGSSIAAELGTMKVTEQIDALRAMAIHPVRYLVVPRVLAAVVMLPIITIFSDAIAVFGGYVVAITSIGVTPHTYTQSLKDFFLLKDLGSGLVKAFFFGGIIAKQRNGPTGDVTLTFLREFTKFVPYSPMMAGENEPDF